MLFLLLALVAGGAWLLGGADRGLRHEHVTVAGVPLEVVHPPEGGRRPAVVVAHGFSGSATLMAPFGDTLAARGYVVVLPDFAGHGADTQPLPDQTASTDESTEALESGLAAAVAHLRSLPDVDPSRIALVGHSMGAGAVTRYAAAHPDVTATVAISLPSAVAASAERPAQLLAVVGALEFPGFRSAAATVAAQRPDRAVRVVPGVEHISVLYAPATHRATAGWLDQAFGIRDTGAEVPFPGRRLAGAALLGLALLLGLHPLAAHLGERRPTTPPRRLTTRVTITAVASGAAAIGALAARFLPTTQLPLAIGGYVAAYAAVTGALLLLYATTRGPGPTRIDAPPAGRFPGPGPRTAGGPLPHQADSPVPRQADSPVPRQADSPSAQQTGSPEPVQTESPRRTGSPAPRRTDSAISPQTGGAASRDIDRPMPRSAGAPVSSRAGGRVRKTFGTLRHLVVLPYAAIAIAVPVHLGMTHAVPVGDRWWLLAVVWAAFALLAYATERVTDGDPIAALAIAAVFVVVLAAAAVTGLTHGFVVLVLFPLIGLLLWQALWSVFLHRFTAPVEVIALGGSLVVAWPLAVTLPLVG